MMLPKDVRQKSGELFPDDGEKQRIFCMGAAFALGEDLSAFEKDSPPVKDEEKYPLQAALDVWLKYKKEKRQKYTPMGLKSLKKKFLRMSGGNPATAMEIVEFSMANNYSGLFAPKDTGYERQQRTFNKINSILNG